MTMLEYLEKDKESLLTGLENAETPEKAQTVIGAEMDRLLLQYNQKCQLPACREAAASMLQTARLSSGLVDSIGEIRVWEEVLPGTGAPSQSRSLREKLLLAAAGICAAAALLIAILADPDSFRAADLLLALLLGAASPVLGYLAGQCHGRKGATAGLQPGKGSGKAAGGKGRPAVRRTQSRVDPQKIYICLHNMILAVDQNLNRLSGENRMATEGGGGVEVLPSQASPLSRAELELFSGLLEAEYSKDGPYALDQIRKVRFYLHQNRIETVDYDGSNEEFFDFMPASAGGTLRPALVKDGQLLRKGLAAGER